MQNAAGQWEPRLKLSEQAIKTSTPGMLQVRRFHNGKDTVADMIFNQLDGDPTEAIIVNPLDDTRPTRLDGQLKTDDLLVPVVRSGDVVPPPEELSAIRSRAAQQLNMFQAGIRQHTDPDLYAPDPQCTKRRGVTVQLTNVATVALNQTPFDWPDNHVGTMRIG